MLAPRPRRRAFPAGSPLPKSGRPSRRMKTSKLARFRSERPAASTSVNNCKPSASLPASSIDVLQLHREALQRARIAHRALHPAAHPAVVHLGKRAPQEVENQVRLQRAQLAIERGEGHEGIHQHPHLGVRARPQRPHPADARDRPQPAPQPRCALTAVQRRVLRRRRRIPSRCSRQTPPPARKTRAKKGFAFHPLRLSFLAPGRPAGAACNAAPTAAARFFLRCHVRLTESHTSAQTSRTGRPATPMVSTGACWPCSPWPR